MNIYSELNEALLLEEARGRKPTVKLTYDEVEEAEKVLKDAGFEDFLIDGYGVDPSSGADSKEIAKVLNNAGFACRLETKKEQEDAGRPVKFVYFKTRKRDVNEALRNNSLLKENFNVEIMPSEPYHYDLKDIQDMVDEAVSINHIQEKDISHIGWYPAYDKYDNDIILITFSDGEEAEVEDEGRGLRRNLIDAIGNKVK